MALPLVVLLLSHVAFKRLNKVAVYVCPISGVVDGMKVSLTTATRVRSRRQRLYDLLITAARRPARLSRRQNHELHPRTAACHRAEAGRGRVVTERTTVHTVRLFTLSGSQVRDNDQRPPDLPSPRAAQQAHGDDYDGDEDTHAKDRRDDNGYSQTGATVVVRVRVVERTSSLNTAERSRVCSRVTLNWITR